MRSSAEEAGLQGGCMLEYEIGELDLLPGAVKSFDYMRSVSPSYRSGDASRRDTVKPRPSAAAPKRFPVR
jgi:hypothetical protein